MPSASFGARLAEWRGRRRESQLSLALAAGVSQRHVSFLEMGRARPSRAMVVRLSDALDIPLRARNELLAAAGFAPLYVERALADAEMRPVRLALERIIAHHDPFPAFVVDRSWAVVRYNVGARILLRRCLGHRTLEELGAGGGLNFMRMMFEPTQMRPRIRNWAPVAGRLLQRLRREAGGDDQSPSARLWSELRSTVGAGLTTDCDAHGLPPTLDVELEVEDATLRLFNTITTFGTPQDVGLQEIRIEMSFAADARTESYFRTALANER